VDPPTRRDGRRADGSRACFFSSALLAASMFSGMSSPRAAEFEVPSELPILPLRESVVFPYMVLPLFITREKSVAAVEDALAGDRLLLLVAQRNPELENPSADDLYRVGTVAMVMRILRMADGRVKALVQGVAKARIESFVENEPAQWAQVTALPEDADGDFSAEAEALARTVRRGV
jgi:ATP-dependent Lon protease